MEPLSNGKALLSSLLDFLLGPYWVPSLSAQAVDMQVWQRMRENLWPAGPTA